METDEKQANYFFIGKDEVQDLGKESFAHFTARTRFRKIFSEHCSGDYEKDFLEKKIIEVLKIENKQYAAKTIVYPTGEETEQKKQNHAKEIISNVYQKASDCPKYFSATIGFFTKYNLEKFLKRVNKKINKNSDKLSIEESTLKDFFDNAPFFESEVLFYHALLAQKKYSSNRYDFFATEKKDSLENSREKFIENLNNLFSSREQGCFDINTFRTCIHYCLSANTSDLSQLNAKERFDYRLEDISILHDDTDVLFAYLSEKKRLKRFDIICDNAGKELFSDLYLACYFLSNNIVEKVVFHLKPYPFFVSDATKEDFGFMMNAIMQYGGSKCAAQCNSYIHEGKIEIEDDMFWAASLCFKEMPKSKLREQLYESDLIIVKGDLNYRRLVEDRNWPYTDSFLERTKGVFGDVPIFAPRVLKSDVLVGVSEAAYHTAKSSDKLGAPADQRFKGNGKWAVVHFRCNKYDYYKKEAQEILQKEIKKDDNDGKSNEKGSTDSTNDKKNVPQLKHGGMGDSKNAETKQSNKNVTEQQDAEKSANGKKNGFYITINLCYILATVLILAMLAVSVIPVIAQTVAIMHEKSDLPKKQETEQVQKRQENSPTLIVNFELPEQSKTEQTVIVSADSDPSEQSEPKQPVKTAELNYGDVAGRIDFTLLLTGYAIFITGTLIIPKVLLKREVEEGVEKYAENTVKKMVDKHFQERIKSTQNELYRTDAQLSRMIAFQLHENYPVWSVGWAYRSLKRYKNLNDTETTFSKYYDFIRFLEVGVIASSIEKFHNEVEKKFKSEHPHESYIHEMFPLNSARTVLKEEGDKAKEENLRPALRAVKDIVDFEYAVRFEENDKLGETEKDILQKVAKFAGLFAKELCAVILWDFSKKQSDHYKNDSTYALENIMQKLLEISNYGTETNAKQDVKQKFQQKLKQTLLQIESAQKTALYDYYDMKNCPDSEYFFEDENAFTLTIKE